MVNVVFDWRELRSLETPSVMLATFCILQINYIRITFVSLASRADFGLSRVTVVATVLRS